MLIRAQFSRERFCNAAPKNIYLCFVDKYSYTWDYFKTNKQEEFKQNSNSVEAKVFFGLEPFTAAFLSSWIRILDQLNSQNVIKPSTKFNLPTAGQFMSSIILSMPTKDWEKDQRKTHAAHATLNLIGIKIQFLFK